MPTKLVQAKSKSVKKNSWKDVQVRARIKRRSQMALGILGLIVGLLLASWTVRFVQNLFAPAKSSVGMSKNYLWSGEFNLNLLIRTPDISLLSYNPKEDRLTIINIPEETFVEVPSGFGSWQIRSVYGLGGDKLLVETLTSFLAIPVDGFLDLSSVQPQKRASEIVQELRSSPFAGFNFWSALKTNLTMWELLKLKLSLSSVRFDKVKEFDLIKLNLLDKDKLSDGTDVYQADPVKLDSILVNLADPNIVSEHKTIAVFNATDHPQLAGKWARLVINLGGNVIVTANAKSRLEKTRVLGEQSRTLTRLQQIFNDLDCGIGQDKPNCGKISLVEEDLNSSRAQINVFLGEDFINR